jgi:hypothetical protein
MVHEHLSGCFISKDPSLGFSELFQIVVVVHGDIMKLVTLMLGASRLLAMAKDTSGLRPNVLSKIFFDLLIIPLSFNFEGHFKNTYPPTSLEHQPLEVAIVFGIQTLLNLHPNWATMQVNIENTLKNIF